VNVLRFGLPAVVAFVTTNASCANSASDGVLLERELLTLAPLWQKLSNEWSVVGRTFADAERLYVLACASRDG
jgi:hypothetical protein